jgi:SpoVK/Ycf46/Vps4 family AAA+-type ATPase
LNQGFKPEAKRNEIEDFNLKNLPIYSYEKAKILLDNVIKIVELSPKNLNIENISSINNIAKLKSQNYIINNYSSTSKLLNKFILLNSSNLTSIAQKNEFLSNGQKPLLKTNSKNGLILKKIPTKLKFDLDKFLFLKKFNSLIVLQNKKTFFFDKNGRFLELNKKKIFSSQKLEDHKILKLNLDSNFKNLNFRKFRFKSLRQRNPFNTSDTQNFKNFIFEISILNYWKNSLNLYEKNMNNPLFIKTKEWPFFNTKNRSLLKSKILNCSSLKSLISSKNVLLDVIENNLESSIPSKGNLKLNRRFNFKQKCKRNNDFNNKHKKEQNKKDLILNKNFLKKLFHIQKSFNLLNEKHKYEKNEMKMSLKTHINIWPFNNPIIMSGSLISSEINSKILLDLKNQSFIEKINNFDLKLKEFPIKNKEFFNKLFMKFFWDMKSIPQKEYNQSLIYKKTNNNFSKSLINSKESSNSNFYQKNQKLLRKFVSKSMVFKIKDSLKYKILKNTTKVNNSSINFQFHLKKFWFIHSNKFTNIFESFVNNLLSKLYQTFKKILFDESKLRSMNYSSSYNYTKSKDIYPLKLIKRKKYFKQNIFRIQNKETNLKKMKKEKIFRTLLSYKSSEDSKKNLTFFCSSFAAKQRNSNAKRGSEEKQRFSLRNKVSQVKSEISSEKNISPIKLNNVFIRLKRRMKKYPLMGSSSNLNKVYKKNKNQEIMASKFLKSKRFDYSKNPISESYLQKKPWFESKIQTKSKPSLNHLFRRIGFVFLSELKIKNNFPLNDLVEISNFNHLKSQISASRSFAAQQQKSKRNEIVDFNEVRIHARNKVSSQNEVSLLLRSKRGRNEKLFFQRSRKTLFRAENEKFLQKKRRRKKLKLETRRRKKRKRFYPRPIWLRYNLYKSFLNKRHFYKHKNRWLEKKNFTPSYLKIFYSKNQLKMADFNQLLSSSLLRFASQHEKETTSLNQRFKPVEMADFNLKSAISSKSQKKEMKSKISKPFKTKNKEYLTKLKLKNKQFYSFSILKFFVKNQKLKDKIYRNNKQKWGNFIQDTPLKEKISLKKFNLFSDFPIYQNKEYYKVSNRILSEFQPLCWKSYWLRSNLMPYMNRIQKNFDKIKIIEKNNNFSNINSFLSKILGFKKYDYAYNMQEILPFYSNFKNSFDNQYEFYLSNLSIFENMNNIAEYNRIEFERFSEILKNVKFNMNLEGQNKPKSYKFIAWKYLISLRELKAQNKKNFWNRFAYNMKPDLSSGSPFVFLSNFSFNTNSSLKPYKSNATLRALWSFNKTNIFTFKEKNKIRDLWETSKLRDQLKTNQTKKFLMNLLKVKNYLYHKDVFLQSKPIKMKDFNSEPIIKNEKIFVKNLFFIKKQSKKRTFFESNEIEDFKKNKFKNLRKMNFSTIKKYGLIQKKAILMNLFQPKSQIISKNLQNNTKWPISTWNQRFQAKASLNLQFKPKERKKQNNISINNYIRLLKTNITNLNFNLKAKNPSDKKKWTKNKNYEYFFFQNSKSFSFLKKKQNTSFLWESKPRLLKPSSFFWWSSKNYSMPLNLNTFNSSDVIYKQSNNFIDKTGFLVNKNITSFWFKLKYSILTSTNIFIFSILFHLSILFSFIRIPELRSLLKFQLLLFYKISNNYFIVLYSIYNLLKKYKKQTFMLYSNFYNKSYNLFYRKKTKFFIDKKEKYTFLEPKIILSPKLKNGQMADFKLKSTILTKSQFESLTFGSNQRFELQIKGNEIGDFKEKWPISFIGCFWFESSIQTKASFHENLNGQIFEWNLNFPKITNKDWKFYVPNILEKKGLLFDKPCFIEYINVFDVKNKVFYRKTKFLLSHSKKEKEQYFSNLNSFVQKTFSKTPFIYSFSYNLLQSFYKNKLFNKLVMNIKNRNGNNSFFWLLLEIKDFKLKSKISTGIPDGLGINFKNIYFPRFFLANFQTQFALLFLFLSYNLVCLSSGLLETSYQFLLKIIDLFESFLLIIYKFLEKPAELMIEWIAQIFLIEWSSDISTFIPETFDMYFWNSFQKFFRHSRILGFVEFQNSTNIYHFINSFKNTNYAFSEIMTGQSKGLMQGSLYGLNVENKMSFVSLIPISNIFGFFMQLFLKNFFHLFMDSMLNPDIDLMVRQKKGKIFWDIWAEILIRAAEQYNINIPSLTSLKEEQEKLIERLIQDPDFASYYTSYKNNYYQKTAFDQKTSFSSSSSFSLLHSSFAAKQRNRNAKRGSEEKNFVSSSSLLRSEKNEVSLLLRSKRENKVFRRNKWPFFFKEDKQRFLHRIEEKKDENSFISFSVRLKPKEFIFKTRSKILKQKFFNKDLNYFSLSNLFKNSYKTKSWSSNQYITFNLKDTDLFLDIAPPKSLLSVNFINSYEPIQYTLGSIMCEIYSGLFSMKVSKNLLIVNSQISNVSNTFYKDSFNAQSKGSYGSLIIQAFAGESEMKMMVDNANRYASIQRGIAVGMKLLRDVFESIVLQTPCFFLMEDIHVIGERRPMLISDDENSKAAVSVFGFEEDEESEKNQMIYQSSKHSISDFRRPYKGDFSMLIPTNLYNKDLYKFKMFQTNLKPNVKKKYPMSLPSIENMINEQAYNKEKMSNKSLSFNVSCLQISSENFFAPPATSPFTILIMKEQKKLKPKKVIKQTVWNSFVAENITSNNLNNTNNNIRVKVAILADMTLRNFSVKLDMITDLLVIIDSVRSNRGFVVFATTHLPSILDPALRRPGRFDETISLPLLPNLMNRWSLFQMHLNATAFQNKHSTETFDQFEYGMLTENFRLTQISDLISKTKRAIFNSNSSYILNNHPLNLSLLKTNLPSVVIENNLEGNCKFPSSKSNKSLISASRSLAAQQLKSKRNEIKDFNNYIFKKLIHPSQSFQSFFIDPNYDSYYKNNQLFSKRTTKGKNLKKAYSQLSFGYFQIGNIMILLDLLKDQTAFSLYNKSLILDQSSTFVYHSLYSSLNSFKTFLIRFLGGKMAEFLITKNPRKQLTFENKNNSYYSYMNKLKNINNILNSTTLFEYVQKRKFDNKVYSSTFSKSLNFSIIDQQVRYKSWHFAKNWIFSILQKRFLYHKNLIITKMLSFDNPNQSSLREPPSPPASSLLMPSKKYENFKRVERDFQQKSVFSIYEKMQMHQKQQFLKKLYNKPVLDCFKSQVFENRLTSFDSAFKEFAENNESFNNKLSSSLFYFKNRLNVRHRFSLINQWWNGQLAEHNVEVTYLSDIDWRTMYIQSNSKENVKKSSFIKDSILDFPDADQHYNQKVRRWFLTSNSWNYWLNLETNFYYEIYYHMISDSFNKTSIYFDQNRELLDFFVSTYLQRGSLKELDFIFIFSRFYR